MSAAFHRFMADRTRFTHPASTPDHDPAVEFYDGNVRIFDQRGDSCTLRSPLPRQLRALITQLGLVADEIERRSYGE